MALLVKELKDKVITVDEVYIFIVFNPGQYAPLTQADSDSTNKQRIAQQFYSLRVISH